MESKSPNLGEIGVTPSPSDKPIDARADMNPEASQPFDTATPTLADAESKRLTAEDAEKSKVEKEAAMSALMDEMETSVETQGQYFIKLGDKVEVETGVDDQRVLLLRRLEDTKEWDPGDRNTEATVVTKGGIKTIILSRKMLGNLDTNYDAVRELIDGRTPAEGTGFKMSDYGSPEIIIGYIPDGEKGNAEAKPVTIKISAGEYGSAQSFKGSSEDFQTRVRKSIDQIESPHKRIVGNDTAEAQFANSAAGFIQNLPPRT